MDPSVIEASGNIPNSAMSTLKSISSAAAKTEIPEGNGTHVIRTLSADSFNEITGGSVHGGFDMQKLVGSIQKDFGIAEGAVGSLDGGAQPGLKMGSVVMEMHVLPGVQGVYQPSFSSSYSGERGFLFGGPLAYVVTGATPNPMAGYDWRLNVTVVPQKLYKHFDNFEGTGFDVPIVYGDIPDLDSIKPEKGNAVVDVQSPTDVDGIAGN